MVNLGELGPVNVETGEAARLIDACTHVIGQQIQTLETLSELIVPNESEIDIAKEPICAKGVIERLENRIRVIRLRAQRINQRTAALREKFGN